MQKKYKNLFYCCFFFLILFLFANSCFAITLEVKSYPPTGASGIPVPTASSTIPEYLLYVFDIGMFVGFFAAFVSLAYAGFLYIISPGVPSALASAKDRLTGSIYGLLILVLAYLIITTLNPALAFFKVEDLQSTPPSPPKPPITGVFLYKDASCPSPDPDPRIMSIPNLSDIKLDKQMQSIKIVNDPSSNTYYFAVLYQNPKLRGECQMIHYDDNCKNVRPFASSADIYQYSNSASGDIYIYRNASFTKDGGFYDIKSSDIQQEINNGNNYVLDLNNTKFTDSSCVSQDSPDGCCVPKTEQDCIKYDKDKKCLQRECPTLGGKNIGSVQIQGNYLLLAVYYNTDDPQFGQEAKDDGAWNYCQSFATIDDLNKSGPREIKWEDARNQGSTHLPNYIIVYPIIPPPN